MGGISIWQLLIVLVIILLLFGAKKLRTVGSDLGSAVKGFRSAMREGEEEADKEDGRLENKDPGRVFEAEVDKEKDKAGS